MVTLIPPVVRTKWLLASCWRLVAPDDSMIATTCPSLFPDISRVQLIYTITLSHAVCRLCEADYICYRFFCCRFLPAACESGRQCPTGGRTSFSPSASVAEMVVRIIDRSLP